VIVPATYGPQARWDVAALQRLSPSKSGHQARQIPSTLHFGLFLQSYMVASFFFVLT
jgi:hypothetical protein